MILTLITNDTILVRPSENVLLTCAPNDDSNQPAHPHGLLRVFVVHIKKNLASLVVKNGSSRDSDQTAGVLTGRSWCIF